MAALTRGSEESQHKGEGAPENDSNVWVQKGKPLIFLRILRLPGLDVKLKINSDDSVATVRLGKLSRVCPAIVRYFKGNNMAG